MRSRQWLMVLIVLGASLTVFGQATDEELLKKADEARFINADSYTFTLKVIAERASENGLPVTSEALLKIFNKRFADGVRTRVEFLEPESVRGTIYLVVGDDIYFWQPGLLHPIPISGQQKLFGDASVAEAAGIQFEEYTVTGREDAELDGRETILLELSERNSGEQAFPSVTLWLGSDDLKPAQALLRAVSGEPLKKVSYLQYAIFHDDEYASEIIVEDLLFQGNKTTMQTAEITIEPLDDRLFDPEQLGK